MLSQSLWTFIFFILHIPSFGRLLDVKKLTMKPVNFGKFTHNNSACDFRFHGVSFLHLKTVTLTKEQHFKNRSKCSVEFYNLPKGKMFLKVDTDDEEEVANVKNAQK